MNQIEEIFISKMPSYAKDAGKLKGHIRFSNSVGEIKVEINPAHCEKIISLMAEAMVDTAKEVAQMMTCEVIDQLAGKLLKDES